MRAPALVGRRWLNVRPEDPAPTVAGLRGRVAVLHFSTSGCVNCTHAEAELDVLAAAHPALVVIGVHSPKFPHEATSAALDAAVDRAGTAHPVLDDAEHATWDAYAVRAWPTLVVIGPDGRIAGTFEGEGHLAGLDALVGALLRDAAPAGADGPVPAVGRTARGEVGGPGLDDPGGLSGLRHPSAALALPDGRLLVADAGHRRLVVLDAPPAGASRGTLGGRHPLVPPSGAAADRADPGGGRWSGEERESPWVSPAGLVLLPPEVAARVGWDVAVADPGAHLVRGVRLADGAVTTVAGTGAALRPDTRAAQRGGPALGAALSSPTGVAWSAGRLVVAMSGVHQLWTLEVAADPADGVLRVVAGSGVEGLLDGAGSDAMLAQPCAVAAEAPADVPGAAQGGPGAAGTPVAGGAWFVDAESSALRRARPADPGDPDGPWEVATLVGTGTYAFGHVDGDAAGALMQHPLGVAVADDGAVLVADTYDGAVRRVDVARAMVTTLVDSLAEPTAVVVVPGGVVVVESAAHRLTAVAVADGCVVAPGPVRVAVDLALPSGQHLDGGPPTVEVTAVPPDLLEGGQGRCGVLVVRAQARTCTDGSEVGGVGAVCRAHERTWRVPVAIEDQAPSEVTLVWDLDRP